MNFPDNKFDYFTVTVDTLGQASKNTFSAYLNEPLKNVVQAKLLSTHIHTSDAVQHLYVDIDELKTMFSERASAEYNGANEISRVRGAFGSIVTPSEHTGSEQLIMFKERDHYEISHEYPSPIRRVDRLTISLLDQTGNTIPEPAQASDEHFLVLQFKCMSPSVILP
jgi:hypothetical protein